MTLGAFLGLTPRRQRAAVEEAFAGLVAQARAPYFFAELGIPDTFDGRFETLALHLFLVLHRLKSDRPASADFAQALFDRAFLDMDRGLRELGAADLGVGRRVKAMMEAFYGRVRAYEAGLAADDAELAAALRRNLYGTVPAIDEARVGAVGRYLRRQRAALAGEPVAELLVGRLRFLPVEAAAAAEGEG